MRVTVKGQVTIPKAVREKLGIKPDSEIDFIEESGRFYLRKVKAQTNPFDQLIGIGTVNMTTDEIMALTRGEP